MAPKSGGGGWPGAENGEGEEEESWVGRKPRGKVKVQAEK